MTKIVLTLLVLILIILGLLAVIRPGSPETSGFTPAATSTATIVPAATSAATSTNSQDAIRFGCDGKVFFDLSFVDVSNSPGPGEAYKPETGRLASIVLDGGAEAVFLRQSTSSPHLFEDPKSNSSLYVEGDEAGLTLGGTVYSNCKAVRE